MWPYMVTLLIRTFIVVWYMSRLLVKNGHKKDTCFNEGSLCDPNIGTILGSIISTLGKVYVIV
jgi:hypothetical protein